MNTDAARQYVALVDEAERDVRMLRRDYHKSTDAEYREEILEAIEEILQNEPAVFGDWNEPPEGMTQEELDACRKALEKMDLEAASAVLADLEAGRQKRVSSDEMKARLGL